MEAQNIKPKEVRKTIWHGALALCLLALAWHGPQFIAALRG